MARRVRKSTRGRRNQRGGDVTRAEQRPKTGDVEPVPAGAGGGAGLSRPAVVSTLPKTAQQPHTGLTISPGMRHNAGGHGQKGARRRTQKRRTQKRRTQKRRTQKRRTQKRRTQKRKTQQRRRR